MQECGYESGNSDSETIHVYVPPKTRRKKFRKTRSNQLMLKQLISKTKKLNLASNYAANTKL
jgi:hypothetical protein